jgi:hypothetical protein
MSAVMPGARHAAIGHDRRRTTRRVPAAGEPVERVRLRAGRELLVLDVCSGGALVEGGTRLLPGTHVDVHVITPAGRLLVRSRVSRACVSELTSDAVTYRGALIFDRGIDVHGYAVPAAPAAMAIGGGTDYPGIATTPAADDEGGVIR